MNRRGILICGILLLLLTGSSIAASQNQIHPDSNRSVNLLFVQSAENGTFQLQSEDTYLLTLQNAVPCTFYFSDRPERIAGSMSNEKYIKMMNWTPAPNAAITLPGANSTEDTLIVELKDPKNDSPSGNLTYTARIVKDYQKDMLSDFLPNVDSGIPEAFGQITLFIDSQSSQMDNDLQRCLDQGLSMHTCKNILGEGG